MKKEKMYLCSKYPHLTMCVRPMGKFDDKGKAVPFKRVTFGIDPTKGAGVFATSDPEIIEKIENSELFKKKIIIELSPDQEIKKDDEVSKVKLGAKDAGNKK